MVCHTDILLLHNLNMIHPHKFCIINQLKSSLIHKFELMVFEVHTVELVAPILALV